MAGIMNTCGYKLVTSARGTQWLQLYWPLVLGQWSDLPVLSTEQVSAHHGHSH